MIFEQAMSLAITRARIATSSSSDVPVGAVILGPNQEIISFGNNQRLLLEDSTAHAEIVAIRSANKSLNSWRLDECTLIVTLEPCAMCAGAIVQSRIKRLVFGAWDIKAGACGSVWDLLRDPRSLHQVEVISGIMKQECEKLIQEFFSAKR